MIPQHATTCPPPFYFYSFSDYTKNNSIKRPDNFWILFLHETASDNLFNYVVFSITTIRNNICSTFMFD